ncbi:MAG: L,D-transpeptidase [Oscillospiraceae bacterium]|nr:L,D-transpeptidase [Oscillospiraceae bacterium]
MKRLICVVLLLLILAGCMVSHAAPIVTSDRQPETEAASSVPETAAPTEPLPTETEAPLPPPALEDQVKMVLSDVPAVTPDSPRAEVVVTFPRVELPQEDRSCSLTVMLDGKTVADWTELELTPSLEKRTSVRFSFDLGAPDRTALLTATLRHGEQTLSRGIVISVDNDDPEVYYAKSGEEFPYAIEVLRSQNVVAVYGKTEEGYTFPMKAWLCSTGWATPQGYFSLGVKREWGLLFGAVWGQYACVITGNILFHSVPYKRMEKDSLKTLEYNKLGNRASAGCVRLPVEGAKWIYENCPSGTSVHIYDVDELPFQRPTSIYLDPEDPRSGWDPTDPDPENPWNLPAEGEETETQEWVGDLLEGTPS